MIDQPVTVGNKEYRITCVSMGNPHCVIFVDDVDQINLEEVGPKFEHNPIFPERVNTEFVQIISRTEAKMRVWERGSGETWACGTGTCATVVACVLNKKTARKVLVHLKGGDLNIDWNEQMNEIFMQGPAEFIFDGTIEI